MTAPPFDVACLPMRMTTSEVCAVAGYSTRTLQRRIKDGLIDLKPIDRGRELLYLRTDVVRALALGREVAPITAPTENRPRVNVDAIRAAMAAPKMPRPAKTAEPVRKPMTPDRHRAFLLSLRPGVRVMLEDDGRYSVLFVARRNHRAESWPALIALPRAQPGPITLADPSQFEALVAEADAVHAECRASLAEERAREVPKTAR